MKRFGILLGILICVIALGAAAAEGTLTLPENVTAIGEEAFRGVSASQVYLPDGLETIGAKAFADSRIKTVYFPATVKEIAEDAFENCSEISASAVKGTYAYDYCVRHGYPIIPLGLTEPESITLTGIPDTRDLYPGQTIQLTTRMEPANAVSDLTYTSSDKKIVTVDSLGNVTGVSKGEAVITVTAGNGKTASWEVAVTHDAAKLTYTLLRDGSGYEITGCEKEAYTVCIPANYNDLPVKAVSGKAFIQCENLNSFTVDSKQKFFYADDGVLFTDSPEKTLVRYPNDTGMLSIYHVPAGTAAIAPYAFSGIKHYTLNHLYFPDGMTTIGDYAFSEVHTQIIVYIPDSVTTIAKNVLQGQNGNVVFCGSNHCTAYEFAQANHVPYDVLSDYQAPEKTAEESDPDEKDATGAPKVDPGNIITVHAEDWHRQIDVATMCWTYNLSASQKEAPSEVRVLYSEQWPELIPSASGRTRNGWPAMTGLYGVGYTKGETWLRGYDLQGNVVGVRKVSGNFVFSFPGAFDIGVSGGENTVLRATPYKPVFVSKAGIIPLEREKMYTAPDGKPFQIYVLMFPGATTNLLIPNDLNCVSYSAADVNARQDADMAAGGRYGTLCVTVRDAYLGDRYSQISFSFDYMQKLLDNSEFSCYAKASYGLTADYAKEVYALFVKVKEKMQKYYFPADYPLHKVKVLFNGNYPGVFHDTIELDEMCTEGIDENLYVLLHEPVHAIDWSYPLAMQVCPTAWIEGRAEYIYGVVNRDLTGQTFEKYISYSWDYLSQADRDDFYRYFYYSTTRETAYPVGWYFVDYLCRHYGENVMQKIMAKVVKIQDASDENGSGDYSEQFKECVTSVTDENVFQDFVKEVVEKK